MHLVSLIRRFQFFLFSLAAVLLGACTQETATPPATAIIGVTVIDANEGVRENQTVVFREDEIVAVGATPSLSGVTRRIDGRGKYLIPGLWDMHVHLTYDDRFTELMPATFLQYGITSVRDTGGLMEKMAPVISAMRAPGAISPRVYFSGPLLDGDPVVYSGVDRPEIGVQNATEEAASQRVSSLKAGGVDFIKIYEMVSPEVFDALVAAAERHDLPIASHVPLSLLASEAGPRVGSMEHIRNVELDCADNYADLLAERRALLADPKTSSGFELRSALHSAQRTRAVAAFDEARCDSVLNTLTETVQVPTARLNSLTRFPVYDRADWPAALAEMPQSVRDDWGTRPSWLAPDVAARDTVFADYTLMMIKRMHAAGVPIGAGTDTPIAYAIPGYSLHSELEVLVAGGLSPLEALRAATERPAEFLNLQDRMGAIKAGMRADLVLLDANPLQAISNTRTINTVVSKGRVVVENP